MLYIILASFLALCLLVAVAVAVISPAEVEREGRYSGQTVTVKGLKYPAMITAAGLLLTLVVLTLLASITTVGARSVGVQTAFGKYQGTLSSGLHFTAPWSGVEEFSTRVQFLDLDGKDENVSVNFKGGGQGSVNSSIRWYIDTDNAKALWEKYRTFDNVRDQLVNSAAKDSFRVVLGGYSPNEARAGENLRPITEAVRADLGKTLARYGVKVDSISVKSVPLSEATQKSLEKIVTANNDVERANSEKERAKIDAQTAKIRQDSGSLSGPALVRYCLEVTNSWDNGKNGALPAGWNCMNPSSLVVTNK